MVICDGSKRSVGSASGQIQPDGSTSIIEFHARPTTKTESLGSVTALELSNLIQAIRWHEPFLRLAPFLIRVDHLTLTYLKELKHSKNPKLLRYALPLSEFDFKSNIQKDGLTPWPTLCRDDLSVRRNGIKLKHASKRLIPCCCAPFQKICFMTWRL
jgi:hypothetical protein